MIRRIIRCPHCGSPDIFPTPGSLVVTGQIYKCRKCDYVGSLIFEEDIDMNQID